MLENKVSPNRRLFAPDANNGHRIILDHVLQRATPKFLEGEYIGHPLDELINNIFSLNEAINNELTLAIIDGHFPQDSLSAIRQGLEHVKNFRGEIYRRFQSATIGVNPESQYTNGNDTLSLSAIRLSDMLSSLNAHKVLAQRLVNEDAISATYIVGKHQSPLIEEALNLVPDRDNLVGFEIKNVNEEEIISFYFDDKGDLVKRDIKLSEARSEIGEIRGQKKIVIAVEGDIAGHAIRVLETARGLRQLGYIPDIIGSGYYMQPFKNEGFNVISPNGLMPDIERTRIISTARGERKGGIFFWDYETVNRQAKQYEELLTDYFDKGIDLFLSDMNPIADIVVGHMQQKFRKLFPIVTETHDIRLSPNRILRTLKAEGIPIGEFLYRINTSPLVNKIDSKKRRRFLIYFFLDGLADVTMGLPLTLYDHLKRPRNNGRAFRRPKRKFTGYLYGRNGTLLFSLDDPNPGDGNIPVGLQADRGKTQVEDWENTIPQDRPLILNTQGSTYHKGAWDIVMQAVTSLPDIFSIHATGRREDALTALHSNSDELSIQGFKVGYVPGYRLAGKADLVIHQGGSGTISQWLLATAERIISERSLLQEIISSGSEADLRESLVTFKGVSRSIAICNTFEQENNALSLNEVGGNQVCTIVSADKLVRSSNPQAELDKLILQQLSAPINDAERKFWIDTVRKISQDDASLHTALVLDRVIYKRQSHIKSIDEGEKPNPYSTVSKQRRRVLAALEAPSIVRTVLRSRRTKGVLDYENANQLLTKSIEALKPEFGRVKSAIQLEGLIGKGYESSVYSFKIGGKRWIMKVGHVNALAAGMYPPSSTEYAEMIRWNRSVLEKEFSSNLPHLLPSPYFVVDPYQIGSPASVQIAPFIEQRSFVSLTRAERDRLRLERKLFDKISRRVRRERKVVPDLVHPSNLVIGMVNNEAHLVLLDMGLQNLMAPTPLINHLAYPAHRISYARDMFRLRRRLMRNLNQ